MPVEIERHKTIALIAYLAVTRQAHSRDTLATLLWPDSDQGRARGTLRRALSELNKTLGGNELQIDRDTLSLDWSAGLWVDVDQFRSRLAVCRTHDHPETEACPDCVVPLTEAVALYRGDLLAGFTLRDSPDFDDWHFLQAESLRRELANALERLAHYHSVQGDFESAIAHAQRWLALDLLNEPAHRQLMRLYAWAGQRSAALRQYQACAQLLEQELGVLPLEETTQLYEALKAEQIPPLPVGAKEEEKRKKGGEETLAVTSAQPHLRTTAPPHNLPAQSTPFLGREEELARITQLLLDDPTCRLLTIAGPGGIGKTRLALQAVSTVIAAFPDGVYFIPLAPVSSADFLVSAIAGSLNFSFYSSEQPRLQLLSYLREKEMLLMLDNFEHLITGAGFLADILENAPGVKLLTTSRERLNLRAEWLFEVKGLKYPLDRNLVSWRNRVSTDVEGYSAVQLFVESARRVHSDFRLSEAEKPFVVRVCQMLEGMPLGIELAAAWVRVLSCAEIAEEIEHNLGFLASPLRDVAERHRSLRAVFEHSWNLLSQEERVTFSKLSVFRGGFRREAAERVAGASLFLLMALADKSLLRRDASGRYDILEVLRQYGAEKLKEAPREYETVQDLHCEYYAEFLHQREEHLRGGRQREALAEIADEIENIRTGWHRALEQRNEEAIRRSLNGLYRFYETRSWFQEGETTFKQATTVLSGRVGEISPALPGSPAPRLLILGKVLARQGGFSYRLGLYENARQLLRESLAILRPLEVPEEIAFTLNNLGDIARLLGEYDEAQQLLQESVEIGRQTGDRRRLARALNNLGIVAGSLGQSEEAKQLFQEALALFRELEDQWGITKALNNLGIIAYYLGEYEDARQLYQASLESRREIGDHYGKALALNNLGLVAHDLGEYAEAKRLHLESMAIFKEIGYLLGTALCLKDLGHVACALQEFRVAEKYFREALKTAMAIRAVPVALHALLGLATLRQAEGEKEQALSLVTLTLHHPASDKETRNRAEHLLSELASQLPPQVIATARERGKTAAFEEEVAKILVGKD